MSIQNNQCDNDSAIIVGGGPVGCMMAIFLAKKHASLFPGGVEIYERRSDSRKSTVEAGRSINLAISSRSFHAWDAVDSSIKEDIHRIGVKMYGRYIHHKDGTCKYQPYGKGKDEYLLSVDRKYLGEQLLRVAEKCENVKIHFETKISGININNPSINVNNETKTTSLIIGADGSNSIVRSTLQKTPKARFEINQQYISYSYKELMIPPTIDGNYAMRNDCLHIWPRGDFMLIALPNPTKDFTLTLFCPYDDGRITFKDHLDIDAKVTSFFKEEFPDAYKLMKDHLLDMWHKNPISELVHVKCYPHHFENKVLLVGDAAHAIIPFYGQGCNAGIEDCRVFSEILAQFSSSNTGKQPTKEILAKALQHYTTFRKPSADAILELSKHNFVEMRAKTASAAFLLQQKLGMILHKIMPTTFKPLYSMVTFTPEMTYSDAWSTHLKREKILGKVAKGFLLTSTIGLGYLCYKLARPHVENFLKNYRNSS